MKYLTHLTAVLVLLTLAASASAQNPQSDLPALRADVARLRSDINAVKRDVATIKSRLPQSDLPLLSDPFGPSTLRPAAAPVPVQAGGFYSVTGYAAGSDGCVNGSCVAPASASFRPGPIRRLFGRN